MSNGSRREMVKHEASRKGALALGSGIATVAATTAFAVVGAPIMAGIALVIGGGFTAHKAYQWFSYRGKWGIRF